MSIDIIQPDKASRRVLKKKALIINASMIGYLLQLRNVIGVVADNLSIRDNANRGYMIVTLNKYYTNKFTPSLLAQPGSLLKFRLSVILLNFKFNHKQILLFFE